MTVSHSSLIIDAGQLLPLEGVGRRGDYPVPTSIFFPSVLHYDGLLTPDNPPAPCRTILLRNFALPFCDQHDVPSQLLAPHVPFAFESLCFPPTIMPLCQTILPEYPFVAMFSQFG